MSNDDRDLDVLLRRNVQRQLAGFDWERQRQTVMRRLAAGRLRQPQKVMRVGTAISAAALLMLAVGYLCLSSLMGTGRKDSASMVATVVQESVGGDSLLASADAPTILLTGPMRWRVLNDPMLTPHSPWDQPRVETDDKSIQGEEV